MGNLHIGDKVSAIFDPKIRDTLRPGVETLIGRRFVFRASFTLGDDEGGPYGGQQVFLSRDPEWEAIDGAGWVPAEDLRDPEPVFVER